MQKLLFFFVGVLLCSSLYSQSGATCATAKIFDSTSTNGLILQTQSQSNQWYKFTSENTKVNVSVFSFRGYTDEIKSVKLWSGTCAGLSLVGSDTVSGATDSMLNINTTTITSGQVYYLEFRKTNSVDTAKFAVDLNFLFMPLTCSTGCGAPGESCNLVCNGNFEFGTTPVTQDQMNFACPWLKANLKTPDYHSSASAPGGVGVPSNFAGNQLDFASGNDYAGIVARWPGTEKEFIYQKLEAPLVACETYAVSMVVSLSDKSRWAVNNLGMYLSVVNPYTGVPGSIPYISAQTISSPATITNTSGWTTINGTYTAIGGEEYISIGCFGGAMTAVTPAVPVLISEGHYAYYYIDQVAVSHVFAVSASASPNSICTGGNSTLSVSGPCNNSGLSYNWLPAGTGTTASVSVTPSATTTYTVVVTDSDDCAATSTVTVTVNPLPVVTQPANITACSGTTVSASSYSSTPTGATYTWTNSNTAIGLAASGSGNTPAFTATNSGSTPISGVITVTPTLAGCVGSPLTYTITVNSTPSMTAPSNVSVCAGVTVAASSFSSTPTGAIFAWTNSNTAIGLGASGSGNVPSFTATNSTASPISGVITVTPTLGSCSGTPVTYTITVNPTPTISVSPSAPSIPAGGSGQIITASSTLAGTTYSWSPSTGLSSTTIANPNANPATTTTYTVIGTANGCTSSAAVTVTVLPPACFNILDYDVPAGSNASTAFGGLTSFSNKTIRINGTLTIDVTPISFSGCNLIMATGAKIVISGSRTMNLSNRTHIFACTDMWDGIYVSSGAVLNVNTDSFIEDGTKAVSVASGSVAHISNAIFNRNYTAIDLTSNTSAISPIDLSGTLFTCRNIPSNAVASTNVAAPTAMTNTFAAVPSYAAMNMKAPYSSYKSIHGILATDVNILNIGLTAAGSTTSGFENLGCGILIPNATTSIVSNVKIYNNKFQNMINGTTCLPLPCTGISGIGIRATAVGTGNNNIKIGGYTALQANTFKDVYSAVELYSYKVDSVIKNTITATTTIPVLTVNGFGKQAIKIQPAASNSIEASQNNIANCATGVWINRNTSTNINTVQTYIDANTITADVNGYCTNAINISDVTNTGSTTTIDKIKVRNNIITEAYTCVTATNVKNGLIVYQNPTLQMRNDGTAVNGVRLQNCLNARVHDNPNITISPTVSPVTSTNTSFKGIYVTTSWSTWVSCNKIFSMGESMVFVGNCGGSSVFNNQMTSGNRGFVLRTNGEIGQQGSTTLPTGLWWNSSFAAQTYTDNTTNANTNSKLYINNTGAPTAAPIGIPTLNSGTNPSFYYSAGAGGLNSISGTYAPQSCASVGVFLPTQSNGTKSYIGIDNEDLVTLATDDNFYPVYEPETQYHSKTIAYEEIDANNGNLISGDTILEDFYSSNQFAPMGLLKSTDKAMAENDYVSAENINNSVIPSNLIEENQKQFNSIYLQAMNDSNYIYSQDDIDDIHRIAVQCPAEAGTSVWQARVLYCSMINEVVEFDETCDQEVRTQPFHYSYGEGGFLVFPNPNNGNMTLVYNIPVDANGSMVIYDITGRELRKYSLQNNSTQLVINENGLSAGQYFCSIYVNNILSGTQKLTIVR